MTDTDSSLGEIAKDSGFSLYDSVECLEVFVTKFYAAG